MNYGKALSIYLDTYEADEIFNNYFTAIRNAFRAGFKAASAEMQADQKILYMRLEVNQDGKAKID